MLLARCFDISCKILKVNSIITILSARLLCHAVALVIRAGNHDDDGNENVTKKRFNEQNNSCARAL